MDPRAELAGLLALWRARLGFIGAERADERLIAVWRGEPDTALEERISELGKAITLKAPRIKARRADELEHAWHVVADERDPAELDRLLRAPMANAARDAHRRLQKLDGFAPDPRIAFALVRFMTTYIGRECWQVSWPIQRSLGVYLSPPRGRFGTLERMVREAIAAMPNAELAENYRRLLPAPPEPAAPEPAPRPAPSSPATSRDAVDLWAQHLADPGNLAIRAVLADALVEAGDPRGEFIAVQTAIAEGNADPELARRAADLLDLHADEWASVANIERASRRFERGFLVAVRCSFLVEPALVHPMWATALDVTIDRSACELHHLLARTPLLHTLAARAFTPATVVPQLRALGIRGPGELRDRRWFPNLEVLAGYRDANIGAFHKHAANIGLSATVLVGYPLHALADALADRITPLRERRFVISRQREVRFDAPGWTIAAPREGTRARIAWVHGSPYDATHVRAILQALSGAGYREVVVHAEGRVRVQVEQDVARALTAIGTLTADFAGAAIDLRAPP